MRVATVGVLIVMWAAAAQAMTPIQRDEYLNPEVEIHPVTVIGGHGVGTNIRFPDSFEEKNVVCGGQCIVVRPGEGAAAAASSAVADDPRNWVMEINTEAQLISLRPKNLPKLRDNPAQGFTTNLFVKMDGGHAVNITLRLLALRDGETNPDGVVNLKMPAAQTLEGKLKAARGKDAAAYQERIERGVAKRLAREMGEGINCRQVNWLPKNHGKDHISLFVREVCSTRGKAKFYWAVFEVENRSTNAVHLSDARLEAADVAQQKLSLREKHFFTEEPLYFGDSARGVATASLEVDEGGKVVESPRAWNLSIDTKSGQQLVAENLRF